MQPFVGSVLVADVAARIEELPRRYLDGRGQLFASRIAHEKVRDGHGDLLADDIFCLHDGPRILDCIEFDDGLRYGDVLADVAFLAMDLERVGAADLGIRFLTWYREFAAELSRDARAALHRLPRPRQKPRWRACAPAKGMSRRAIRPASSSR